MTDYTFQRRRRFSGFADLFTPKMHNQNRDHRFQIRSRNLSGTWPIYTNQI